MFEKASRLKLHFDSSKGLLSVEDLWDLPLTSNTGKASLDGLAKAVNRQLKDTQEESFVTPASKADEILQLKLEILKHIIQVRLVENETAAQAQSRAAQRQEILGLIKQKEGEALAGTSLEDLKKMAEELKN